MKSKTVHRAVALLLLVAAMVGVYLTPLREYVTLKNARAIADQMAGLWYGPLIFVLAYAIGATLFIPATVFVVCAGVIWGWKLGSVYSLIGGMAGAALSYVIANFLGGGVLERFGRRGVQVAQVLKTAGFRTLLILRLIGVIPFGVYNYGAGVAHVRFRDYLTSTFAGLLPGAFVFTYSADALLNGTLSSRDALYRVLGAAAVLLLLVLSTTLLKKRVAPATIAEFESEAETGR